MTEPIYSPDAGDIVWLDLNPRTGNEQSGRRPCLVLSSRLYSERTGMAVVCPVMSKIKRLPFEIVLAGTKTEGAVLPIYIRSIDLEARFPKFIERIPTRLLDKTRDYVRVIIGAVE